MVDWDELDVCCGVCVECVLYDVVVVMVMFDVIVKNVRISSCVFVVDVV